MQSKCILRQFICSLEKSIAVLKPFQLKGKNYFKKLWRYPINMLKVLCMFLWLCFCMLGDGYTKKKFFHTRFQQVFQIIEKPAWNCELKTVAKKYLFFLLFKWHQLKTDSFFCILKNSFRSLFSVVLWFSMVLMTIKNIAIIFGHNSVSSIIRSIY